MSSSRRISKSELIFSTITTPPLITGTEFSWKLSRRKERKSGVCCLCDIQTEAKCLTIFDTMLFAIMLVVTVVDISKLAGFIESNVEDSLTNNTETPFEESTSSPKWFIQYLWDGTEDKRNSKILCDILRIGVTIYRLVGSTCLALGVFKNLREHCIAWIFFSTMFVFLEVLLQAFLIMKTSADTMVWVNCALGVGFLIAYQTYGLLVLTKFISSLPRQGEEFWRGTLFG